MSNSYLVLKAENREELHAFPIQFAFNKRQFAEGMKALGLTEDDTDKVVLTPGNGFVRKTDAVAFMGMFKNHENKHLAAIAADTDGTGYIYDMLFYELNNHEYNYTGNAESALKALGLTQREVEANPVMAAAFKRAKEAQSN